MGNNLLKTLSMECGAFLYFSLIHVGNRSFLQHENVFYRSWKHVCANKICHTNSVKLSLPPLRRKLPKPINIFN